MDNITHLTRGVHRASGLLSLLHYALHHPHSRRWIPALLVIMAREEVARG